MIEMYYSLVLAKKRTCNSDTVGVKLVPVTHRADVLNLLNTNGYDADGNKGNFYIHK